MPFDNMRDPLAVFEEKDMQSYGLSRRPTTADKIAMMVQIQKELEKPVFRPKTRVVLRNLVARPELNGRLGEVVTELKEKGRFRVKLLAEPDAEAEVVEEETPDNAIKTGVKNGDEQTKDPFFGDHQDDVASPTASTTTTSSTEERGAPDESAEMLAVKPENLQEARGKDKWIRVTYSVTINSVTSNGEDGPRAFPKDVRLRAPLDYVLDHPLEEDFARPWWLQPIPQQKKVFTLPHEHHGQMDEILDAKNKKKQPPAAQDGGAKNKGDEELEPDNQSKSPATAPARDVDRKEPAAAAFADAGLPKYEYKPLIAENLVQRKEKYDDYDWLVDCYRMRLSDEMYWCVGSTYNGEHPDMKIEGRKFYPNRRGFYAQARSATELKKLILLDLALFLGLCAFKKMLPPDFDTEKFLSAARRENKLVTPFPKSMAIDKWGGENVFCHCRSLRRTAEAIYGTPLADLSKDPIYNRLVRAWRDELHLEKPPPDQWAESKDELPPAASPDGTATATSSAESQNATRPVHFTTLLENFFLNNRLLTRMAPNPFANDNIKRLWETNFLKHPDFLIPAELVERCATLSENIDTEAYSIKIFPWEEERPPGNSAVRIVRMIHATSSKLFHLPLEHNIDDLCLFTLKELAPASLDAIASMHTKTMGQGAEEINAFVEDVKQKYGIRHQPFHTRSTQK
ncbi:unnamed protein product [Amoebophrya sp. A120]|nr:unnamed protein product [Amoebophrya sp. A120]|eukprot:GSA120T00003522001.1